LEQTVASPNEALKKRVEVVLDMAVTTVGSLKQAFVSKPVGLGVEESEKLVGKADNEGDGQDSHSEDSDVDSLLEVHD
jgi:cleavage and polyadenylation specificity factor subunit 3